MKKPSLREDVEELVEKIAIAEAGEAVLDLFEKALDSLPNEDRWILEQHFQGISNAELCDRRKLSAQELDSWLVRAKRNLLDNIRRTVDVRQ